MIVPAGRIWFSSERYQPSELIPGTRLETDSGMGGSHTVIFQRRTPAGRLAFSYHHPFDPDLHGREIPACTIEEAAGEFYTLHPEGIWAREKLLPRYAIGATSFVLKATIADTAKRALRDNMGFIVVGARNDRHRTNRPHRMILAGAVPTDPILFKLFCDSVKTRIKDFPMAIGENYTFETLTLDNLSARETAMPVDQRPARIELSERETKLLREGVITARLLLDYEAQPAGTVEDSFLYDLRGKLASFGPLEADVRSQAQLVPSLAPLTNYHLVQTERSLPAGGTSRSTMLCRENGIGVCTLDHDIAGMLADRGMRLISVEQMKLREAVTSMPAVAKPSTQKAKRTR